MSKDTQPTAEEIKEWEKAKEEFLRYVDESVVHHTYSQVVGEYLRDKANTLVRTCKSEIASLQQRVQELEKEKVPTVDEFITNWNDAGWRHAEALKERLQQLEGEKWIKLDDEASIRVSNGVFLLVYDACYTFFKANAEGDEGKIVCVMEDAHGRREMNCYTTDELKQKFPGAAEQILTLYSQP